MNQNDIENKYKEIVDGRLKGFQKESVSFICDRFNNGKRKCLLADEVGLGKTEVAKGVIARLSRDHWNTQNRAFRVAYICPNQNIAEQNAKKLNIYGDKKRLCSLQSIYNNQLAVDRLRAIIDEFRKKENREIKYKNGNIKFVIRSKSVYTRVWDYLTYPEDESNIFEDYIAGKSDEWKQDYYLEKEEEIEAANTLRRKMIEAIETVDKDLAELIKNAAAVIDKAKKTINAYYEFNKMVFGLLNAERETDYRLSMLHMMSGVDEKSGSDAIMQFDCLTPKTSFVQSLGKDCERALVGATYDAIFDREIFIKDPKSQGTAVYENYYHIYKLIIKAIRDTASIEAVESRLQEIKSEIEKETNSEKRYLRLREELIYFNTKKLSYDLVVMDEFQNYNDLTKVNAKDMPESGKIAKSLFENGKTKVLMLSATPFAIADYISEIIDDSEDSDAPVKTEADEEAIDNRKRIDNKEAAFEQFFDLAEFMIGNRDDYDSWKEKWITGVQNNDTVNLQKLLMEEAGIIRTERAAASLHSPIKRAVQKIKEYDFSYPLLANNIKNFVEYKWVTSYGRTTPFALTFASTYHLDNTKANKKQWVTNINGILADHPNVKNAFISLRAYDGNASISTKNMRFEELKKIIFNPDGIQNMLWILPSRKCEPKGVFENKKGVSKNLIFTHYRMSAMAITYLLCHEANVLSCRQACADGGKLDEQAIKDYIGELLETGRAKVYNHTREKLAEYFFTLFNSSYARNAVWKNWQIMNPGKEADSYFTAVKEYCEAGCLPQVIDEYIELLENEYSNNKERDKEIDKEISRVISKIQMLLENKSYPKLVLYDDTKSNNSIGELKELSKRTKNIFAAGLYSEKVSDTAKRLKEIKPAFNSPFLPFVFSTTSIGTEGIDLHWYARNVFHWSLPDRPLDIEQREGRVLRYKSHAYRLNEARITEGDKEKDKAKCLKPEWRDSGMYETQLNYNSDKELVNEEIDGCYHIHSFFIAEEKSLEDIVYEEKEKIVQTYRKILGRTDNGMNKDELCLSPWVYYRQQS
jgi:hypothetical protein